MRGLGRLKLKGDWGAFRRRGENSRKGIPYQVKFRRGSCGVDTGSLQK